MNDPRAIDAFAALAHETRLGVFRMLVREAPAGVPALEIARRLDARPSTLSGHLSVLRRSGLVTATRRQREILYAVDFNAVGSLVTFLLADCCGGNPETCRAVLAPLAPLEGTPEPGGPETGCGTGCDRGRSGG